MAASTDTGDIRPEIAEALSGGALWMGRSSDDLDGEGHHVSSRYVDLYWTPMVGPSVVSLLRWSIHRLPSDDVGVRQIDAWEIPEALGRLAPTKAAAVVVRTVQFGAATFFKRVQQGSPPTVIVREFLPCLSAARLDRLSPVMRKRHEMEMGR